MYPRYLLLKGNKSGNRAMGLYSKHGFCDKEWRLKISVV